MAEWNSDFWNQVITTDYNQEIQEQYDQLTYEQKNGLTRYMPPIPVPTAITRMQKYLTPAEIGILTFAAVSYPSKRRDPDLMDQDIKHRQLVEQTWEEAKTDIEELMETYIKHCIRNDIRANMGMTKEAAAFDKEVRRVFDGRDDYKGSKKVLKDKFLHI